VSTYAEDTRKKEISAANVSAHENILNKKFKKQW
jgi:hypothetical protein